MHKFINKFQYEISHLRETTLYFFSYPLNILVIKTRIIYTIIFYIHYILLNNFSNFRFKQHDIEVSLKNVSCGHNPAFIHNSTCHIKDVQTDVRSYSIDYFFRSQFKLNEFDVRMWIDLDIELNFR